MLMALTLSAVSNSFAEEKLTHKVVFELTSNSTETWEGVLNNVENLQKSLGKDSLTIEVVAHSKGIVFLKSNNEQFRDRMAALSQKNVIFAACENSMRKNNLSKQDLLSFVTTVDSGVGEVVRKEEAGWSYLKSGG